MPMKKGHRRKSNKRKNKTIKLSARQIQRVHKARKKLRKNPAFVKMDPLPPSMVDAVCGMAVLSILKTLGVSSKSILEILLPVASELLEKSGMPTDIPIGGGISVGLNKKPEC